jgi:hypothetical protein
VAHTYIGKASKRRKKGEREFYYHCNAAHSPVMYGLSGRYQASAIR